MHFIINIMRCTERSLRCVALNLTHKFSLIQIIVCCHKMALVCRRCRRENERAHNDVINGNIFCVTGLLYGEFTVSSQPTVTRSFDIFVGLRLNKRLSKQSWGCWWDILCSSWRHCKDLQSTYLSINIQITSLQSSLGRLYISWGCLSEYVLSTL